MELDWYVAKLANLEGEVLVIHMENQDEAKLLYNQIQRDGGIAQTNAAAYGKCCGKAGECERPAEVEVQYLGYCAACLVASDRNLLMARRVRDLGRV